MARRLAYYPENRGHEKSSGISLEVSFTAAAFLRCLVSITHDDDTKSLCVFISFRAPLPRRSEAFRGISVLTRLPV